jgi:hypothetical protein
VAARARACVDAAWRPHRNTPFVQRDQQTALAPARDRPAAEAEDRELLSDDDPVLAICQARDELVRMQ